MQAATGNLEAALADLTTAILNEPNRVEFYLSRANVEMDRDETELARADFDKAVQLDPHHANALQLRARFLVEQGEFALAITDLTTAIEDDPKLLSAWRMRGIAYRFADEYDKAISDLQNAIDSDSSIDDMTRAELLYQQGVTFQAQENHASAVEKFVEATKRNPGLAVAYFAAAMSYGGLEDIDHAKQSIDQAIEADPTSSEYLLARANLHAAEAQYLEIVQEGDPAAFKKKAFADIERAVEVNPDDDAAWYSLRVPCIRRQTRRCGELSDQGDRHQSLRGPLLSDAR